MLLGPSSHLFLLPLLIRVLPSHTFHDDSNFNNTHHLADLSRSSHWTLKIHVALLITLHDVTFTDWESLGVEKRIAHHPHPVTLSWSSPLTRSRSLLLPDFGFFYERAKNRDLLHPDPKICPFDSPLLSSPRLASLAPAWISMNSAWLWFLLARSIRFFGPRRGKIYREEREKAIFSQQERRRAASS